MTSRLQFSLRALFIVTAAVAVGCWILVTKGKAILILLPLLLIAAIVANLLTFLAITTAPFFREVFDAIYESRQKARFASEIAPGDN